MIIRYLYLVTGLLSVLLGALGVYLPLLPTTPFLILASFCFARSSPRLQQWLLNQPLIGPYLQKWKEEHAIPLKAKIYATAVMMVSLIVSFTISGAPRYVLIIIGLICTSVLIYIWRQPHGSE